MDDGIAGEDRGLEYDLVKMGASFIGLLELGVEVGTGGEEGRFGSTDASGFDMVRL